MRIHRLLLAPLALAAAPAAAQSDPAVRVDSLFAAWNSPQSAGCAVGVAQNGRTLLSRAYGSANLEHGIPNTPETVFEAGSVSNQSDAFSGPGGSVIRFIRGADGRVQAFTFGTDRVRELRFDRVR